jgi:plastocyanin
MKHLLPFTLALPLASLAQAPVITSLTPLANAHAVPQASPITATFSQTLTAASAGALQVFSSQRGGRRTSATPAVVSANTLKFTPTTYAFRPGEKVQYTVTRTAAGLSTNLARPWVGQFTTAVGGTGRGSFQLGSDPLVGTYPTSVAVGDVDNDGDLDLIAGNYGGTTASVRLNTGNGTFSTGQEMLVGDTPTDIAVGDVDGDGDLDLVITTANFSGTGVSVRLNSGNGTFTVGQNIVDGRTYRVELGDVDGDGDLDMLTLSLGNTVSVRLNNGNGTFSNSSQVNVGNGPFDLVIGDVDGDGDLDLLTANDNTNTVSVRLNNGAGTFSGDQDVVVGTNPTNIVLGDLDGDGDLDFVTANQASNTITVRLNTGSGTFSNGQSMALLGVTSLAVADVDSDGDLDLLVTNVSINYSSNYNMVNVRLNDGSGTFSGGQDLLVGSSPRSIVPADVDNDGDLDLLTANYTYNGTVSVRLNGGTVLAAAPQSPSATSALFPNPAHHTTTLTGAEPHATLTVLDELGRAVLHTTADASGIAQLTLPDQLPAGVYLVQGGRKMYRLLVE